MATKVFFQSGTLYAIYIVCNKYVTLAYNIIYTQTISTITYMRILHLKNRINILKSATVFLISSFLYFFAIFFLIPSSPYIISFFLYIYIHNPLDFLYMLHVLYYICTSSTFIIKVQYYNTYL